MSFIAITFSKYLLFLSIKSRNHVLFITKNYNNDKFTILLTTALKNFFHQSFGFEAEVDKDTN